MSLQNGLTSRLVLIASVLALTACASTSQHHNPEQRQLLLSGEVLFDESVPAAAPVELFQLTDEMRQWLTNHATNHPYAKTRLRRLLQAMLDDGLLDLDYEINRSYTAQQTFAQRTGNCLSFSILFVALARELRLDAEFQLVEIPPSFSAEEELVLLNNHINVRIKGIRSDVNHVQDHIVDFNSIEYNGNYDTHRVSDAYATSLYHGNRAVEFMGTEQYEAAFRQLKRGLELAPDVPGLWINLGVLYARMEHWQEAEAAYRTALDLDANNKSALVNLARAMRQSGNTEQAERLAQRVQRYMQNNPYFYSQHAREAISRGELDKALALLRKAIALKDDEHQFYHLRGIALYRQGELQAARQSLQEAKNVAHRADLQNIYQRKLRAFEAEST